MKYICNNCKSLTEEKESIEMTNAHFLSIEQRKKKIQSVRVTKIDFIRKVTLCQDCYNKGSW